MRIDNRTTATDKRIPPRIPQSIPIHIEMSSHEIDASLLSTSLEFGKQLRNGVHRPRDDEEQRSNDHRKQECHKHGLLQVSTHPFLRISNAIRSVPRKEISS